MLILSVIGACFMACLTCVTCLILVMRHVERVGGQQADQLKAITTLIGDAVDGAVRSVVLPTPPAGAAGGTGAGVVPGVMYSDVELEEPGDEADPTDWDPRLTDRQPIVTGHDTGIHGFSFELPGGGSA